MKALKLFTEFDSKKVKNLMRRLDLNGNRKISQNELTEALSVSTCLM